MNARRDDFPLTLAGRRIDDAGDRIRRYCGVPWSGGPPETWAFPYYDAVESGDPEIVTAVDVLAAGVLHPGLQRSELAFFREQAQTLTEWLRSVPLEASLRDADDDLLNILDDLACWAVPVSLGLLTKVLHRKRPEVVPLLDRHVIDWYRPVTGERAASAAWSPLLRSLRADLSDNAATLDAMRTALTPHLPRVPTAVRLADITVWMGGR